jgi:hypothetical protein
MKVEKSQVTQTITVVTLETFQECEMLRVIALAARNKIKEDETFGNQAYCNTPINVWYQFIDKLREVANV